MILKTFLLLSAGLAFGSMLIAQCENCTPVEGYEADYCFTHEALPGYCAQFKLNDSTFYLQKKEGKEPKMLNIPEDMSMGGMVAFISNKDNKIKSATDALFVSKALDAWDKKKGTLVADKAAEQKFTGEELKAMKFEQEFPSGLKMHIVHQGNGPKAKRGQNVSVHYRGYLLDGKIFDESYQRGQPIKFPLGMGRVIKGWDEAIGYLNMGTRALIYLPAEIAYGQRGAGADIPPGATLVFDVILMDIK